jgi:hypothetical protein
MFHVNEMPASISGILEVIPQPDNVCTSSFAVSQTMRNCE